jgi:photosystem II stability/assembly factor-like uncharacterized protein
MTGEPQMDTPLSARVAKLTTRLKDPSFTRTRIVLVLVLVTTAGLVPSAAAQDEPVPEPAVMAPLAAQSLALDVVAVDGKHVAVGERGHVLISTDGGGTWQQQNVPTGAALTGVYFHDSDLGWVVGHDSVILRTSDGGSTWEIVNWAPEEEAPFFDIWFSDASNGIAIGAYGSYYVTSDGGTTWAFEPISDTDWHLHQIARAEDGRLYLAAEAGFVYRSDDGGATWDELPSPYEGSFFGVLPFAEHQVLLFGLRGHLFRSEDAGETWNQIDTGTVAMLTSGLQLADGRIVITGLGGTLLVSDDGGRSFTGHQQPDRRGIQAAVETDDGSLVLVGEFGVRTLPISELSSGKDR